MKYLLFLAFISMVSGCMCCGSFNEDAKATADAVDNKNPNECSKIESDFWRVSCCAAVGQQLQDTVVCDKAADEECKDYCYVGVSDKKKDRAVCEKIKSTTLRNQCLSKL